MEAPLSSSVFIMTVREPIHVELLPVPVLEPSQPTVSVLPPAPAGTTFPWVSAGLVGIAFDRAPTFLKDAISWFFPASLWENAAQIARCESNFSPGATHDTRGTPVPPGFSEEFSVGIWQINLLAHPSITEAVARDGWSSTSWAAAEYHRRGNWGAWACCALNLGLPGGELCRG